MSNYEYLNTKQIKALYEFMNHCDSVLYDNIEPNYSYHVEKLDLLGVSREKQREIVEILNCFKPKDLEPVCLDSKGE